MTLAPEYNRVWPLQQISAAAVRQAAAQLTP
jgi:hypothetical protein